MTFSKGFACGECHFQNSSFLYIFNNLSYSFKEKIKKGDTNMKKKIFSAFVAVLFVITSCILPVSAYDVDSSGIVGPSSGSETAKGGYYIFSGNTEGNSYKNIIGYRFSVIDKDTGELLNGTKVVDIFKSSWLEAGSITSYKVTNGRYNKIQMKQAVENGMKLKN